MECLDKLIVYGVQLVRDASKVVVAGSFLAEAKWCRHWHVVWGELNF